MKKNFLLFSFATLFGLSSSNLFGQAAFTYTLNPASGCAPVTAQFYDQSIGTSDWFWDFGDSNTSGKKNPDHTYGAAGTYTVKLKIKNGTDSISQSLVVHAIPTASFTISTPTICAGTPVNFTSTSTAGSGTIAFIKWDFGDGKSDTTFTQTNTHTYTSAGTYPVNIIVVNSFGCDTVSPSQLINVAAAPIANFIANPSSSCGTNTQVTFTNTSFGDTSGATYLWNFGDPSSGTNDSSTLFSPSHTFVSYGSYNIALIAAKAGCFSTYNFTFVQQPFNLVLTGPDTVCYGSPVFFSDTLSNPKPTYQMWNFGDLPPNDTSTMANPTHLFSSPGTFNISLTANINGQCSTTVTHKVYVRSVPDVSFSANDTVFCKASTVNFTGASTSNIVSWAWNFGDPNSGVLNAAAVQNPSHYYSQSGFYTVTLVVTDSFGCVDSLKKVNYININPPSVNITTAPDSGCAPKSFPFVGVATTAPGDTVKQYMWNFGDGSKDSTGASVSHSYSVCGIYDVSLTVTTQMGCVDTFTVNGLARVGNHSTVRFNPDSVKVCYGAVIQFTDSSTADSCQITAWEWNFGAFSPNPPYLYSDTGKYDVQLKVYSNGCADSLLKPQMITVYPPVPNFIPTFSCTNPYDVVFTDLSHGADWKVWDFGDGSPRDSSNIAPLTHTYGSTGTYVVTLSDTNITYGCRYDSTKTIRITIPQANFPQPPPACHPATITFDGTGSQDANTYTWDFGDPASGPNNIGTGPQPVHIYQDTGSYIVKLVITDIHNCQDSIIKQVRVNGPYAGFTSNVTQGCSPLNYPFPVQFTDTSVTSGSSVAFYQWNFNYGNTPLDTSTTTNPVVSHSFQTGIYHVSLVVTDVNGCTDTLIKNNYITATCPNSSLVADTFICPNVAYPYVVHPGVQTSTYSVYWNFGDGSTPITVPNDSTINHIYTTNGTYTDSVIVTDANGCADTITQNIYVYKPTASFIETNSAVFCGYKVLTLSGSNADYINKWKYTVNGPFGIIKHNVDTTDSVFTVSLNYPGTWTITLEVTNPGGCMDDTTSIPIVVAGPGGYFTFSPDHGCSPLTVTFHVDSVAGATYLYYDFGDGTVTPHLPNTDTVISHTYYGNNGSYFIPQVYAGDSLSNGNTCAIVLQNENPALLSLDTAVTINTPISINISQDTILIYEGDKDTLTATPYNATWTYTWKAIPSGTVIPPLTPPSTAGYIGANGDSAVVLTVRDPNGCEAYDTVYVIIKPCEEDLKIPNVFTPNDDKKNDTYHIKHLCPNPEFKIIIYNRWGNVVYESTDYAFKWDGKDDNGKDCAVGTYYYTLRGKKGDLHGYIQLIRD